MAVEVRRHRFTVEEYYRMGESGIFGEDDRVELLDGEIVEMASIGSPHAGCVNRLNGLFARRLGDRATIAVQNPVRLSTTSEPQPDLAVATHRDDGYAAEHPKPRELYFLVEVADSTAAFDREVKILALREGGRP